jgi:adenine-specific DNA-methyltransferase
MSIDTKELYSTKEAAEALRVSEITLKRYIASGSVPSTKIVGRRRISGADLQRLVQIQKNDSSIQINKPKGGCELTYPGKTSPLDIITLTKPAVLKKIKEVGDGRDNKLVFGDNLSVLKSFYDDPNIRGAVDLVYIDPPFGTGQEFVGYDESASYNDGLINTEFIEFLRQRLVLLRELLSDSGSLYLHIDNKIGHYIKIVLDEVFGDECFRNDITRIKCNPKNFYRKAFGNIKDVVYFYSKSKAKKDDHMYWSDYRVTLTASEIEKQFPKIDSKGRRYATTPLHAKGETKNGPTGRAWKNMMPPHGRHWRYNPDVLTDLDRKGLIEWSSNGNPRKIIYADENPGKKIQDVWDFRDPGFENSTYPTEKNIDLLKQVILASSKENGLVLDCFAGSGTTLVAAAELNRKWIGVDSNQPAIKACEQRLSGLKASNAVPAFTVYEAIT